jgi:hypothetical protein
MDEYFKKEDEITLAGIARQDVELYGAQLRQRKSFWHRLATTIKAAFGPRQDSKAEEHKPGK